jgi:hypothetical protein
MLDDGVRSMGKQLRVVDVSTLLVESMEQERADSFEPRRDMS